MRKPPGHHTVTTFLHRLDPQALQETLRSVFPAPSNPAEVLVADAKVRRGSRKGNAPQVKRVEVLALHLRTPLA